MGHRELLGLGEEGELLLELDVALHVHAVAGFPAIRRGEKLLADGAVENRGIGLGLVRCLCLALERETGLAVDELEELLAYRGRHLEVARDIRVLRAVVDRELEKQAAGIERGGETRERGRFHEDVGRDAAAAVDSSAGVRPKGFLLLRGGHVARGPGLLALTFLVLGREVFEDILVVALDAAARGRVVLRRREREARAAVSYTHLRAHE